MSVLDTARKGLDALIQDWQRNGWSLLDLVDMAEHTPEKVMDLAAAYGLGEVDLRKLVEMSHKADDILRELTQKDSGPSYRETNREWARRMLREVRAEMGEKQRTGGTVKPKPGGKRELPEEMARHLRAWLKAKRPISEFFKVNADILGDPRDYELRPFVEDDAGWVERINE